MKTSYYPIASFAILPFRCNISHISASGIFSDDKWETSIEVSYNDTIQIGPILDTTTGNPLQFNTSLCTMITIRTILPFNGNIVQAKEWVRDNAAQIIINTFLPKLNYFFLLVKYNRPNAFDTGVIRSGIGDIDLIFNTLEFDNEIVMSRGSSTFFSGRLLTSPDPLELDLSNILKNEWIILTRAVDLINHGYYLESFIVGFALLDDIIQTFIKNHLPNLNSLEADSLMRSIEHNRLLIYLGPLTRLLLGESPLDNKELYENLKWLNSKRNKIMHDGEDCKRNDARHALDIILSILRFYQEKEGCYCLPDNLGFWT